MHGDIIDNGELDRDLIVDAIDEHERLTKIKKRLKFLYSINNDEYENMFLCNDIITISKVPRRSQCMEI